MFLFSCATAPDVSVSPAVDQKIVPPGENVPADIRAAFGPTGRWGGADGSDGIWFGTDAMNIMSRVPGKLTIFELTSSEAIVQINYGKQIYIRRAVVIKRSEQICLQVEKLGFNSPTFCYQADGKIIGTWNARGGGVFISLVPVD